MKFLRTKFGVDTQVVFVLERGQTHTHRSTHKDATNHSTHALATAGVGNYVELCWYEYE